MTTRRSRSPVLTKDFAFFVADVLLGMLCLDVAIESWRQGAEFWAIVTAALAAIFAAIAGTTLGRLMNRRHRQ